ncbi:hypothetical protein [Ammoniphilus sp. CFH 90114]|nr:hypothetical protein [Ammoniphilus sp. CFH 90114]
MAKLRLKNRELSSPEYLKKLQDLQKESGKMKRSTKLKGSVAATE